MQTLFDIAGKVAVVTGGTGGIGLMISEGLVRAGARVYIASRKQAACDEAQAHLAQFGECTAIAADVSTEAGCQQLADAIRAQEDKVHVLVNNAGVTWGASFDEYPEAAWEKIFSLNVKGPFAMTRALVPLLEAAATEEDPARVINITSIAGIQTDSISAYAYGPSKAALNHLTRMLAKEFIPRKINVNAIAPGFFPSKMTAFMRQSPEMEAQLAAQVPMKRIGKPEDIAGLAIYLSAPASAYMTGNIIPLDGGILVNGGV